MKLIIPNAKELNTNLDNFPFQDLSEKSEPILEVIGKLSLEELSAFYKLPESRAQLEFDRWQRIQSRQAKSYPAWQLYDGLMYRYMDRRDVTEEEISYLKTHVRLATALYGLINPFELISPHRLDFQGSLKIGQQSLKQYWRSYYDQEVVDDDVILSLASSEFEQVFSPRTRERLIKVIFMEERVGELKIHSTISKKGRGRMLSWLAKNNIQALSDLRTFQLDGFRYCSKRSTETQFTFIRLADNVNF
ncbi:peroxide stress protein YaaA [Streptococcus ruminantium]|uniref:peroxide stress protein YaaA n=1 Tax=Streptococcus ruminantium TaxID=1917441 RepID=UPI0012DD1D92|nr:peroxide stress protein YaaA [Streptococcus ruminantium]